MAASYVTFGSYNSRVDFHLDFIHREISPPAPKTATVNIPLAHGILDLTERLTGTEPIFNNRNIDLAFELRSMRSAWMTDYANIMQCLHGRVLNVTLSNDSAYYWNGRVTVGMLEDHGFTAGITISIDAFPFKWKNTSSTVGTYTLSSTARSVTVNISDQIALPEFSTSGTANIEYNGQIFAANSSVLSPPGMLLKKGSCTVKLTGSGSCTVRYRGGAL